MCLVLLSERRPVAQRASGRKVNDEARGQIVTALQIMVPRV